VPVSERLVVLRRVVAWNEPRPLIYWQIPVRRVPAAAGGL